MKNVGRGVSGIALLFGLAGMQQALAQQTTVPPSQPNNQTVTTNSQPPTTTAPAGAPTQQVPAAVPDEPTDRVVVVGSLIATTREDAAKPVEVYSFEDLEEQGSPSVSDFVRSLTMSTGDDLGFGQANPACANCSGFANANLRGLGANGTLVLRNGRRVQATNGGIGADLNTIPVEALESVEILKDGASATYGAGAVGGVINFTTRRDIDAPQIKIENNSYAGSDGAYKVDFLTGWVGDDANFLLSLSYSHEDPLSATERDFGSAPFALNPSQFTITAANPGRFQVGSNFLSGALQSNGTLVAGVPAVGAALNDYRTAADCTAIGGVIISATQPGNANTGCGFPLAPFQRLVDENDVYRVYSEFNGALSDRMEFHVEASYTSNNTKSIAIPPATLNRSTEADVTRTSAAAGGNCASSCVYTIPYQVNIYDVQGRATPTVARNPFIDDFNTRTGAAVPTTGNLYTSGQWRPFLSGGNPLYGDGMALNHITREGASVAGQIKGEFGGDDFLGQLLNGVTYDYSAQYNLSRWTHVNPDVFVSRLQNALLGYGGPNCNAVDRVPTSYAVPNRADFPNTPAGTTAYYTAYRAAVAAFNRTVGIQSDTAPGTNGCQWFNPFASAYSTSIINGAANPQFNSGAPVLGVGATSRTTGYANPSDLADWLTTDKLAEDNYESMTFEGIWTGTLPEAIALPGGEISWALGTQWRMIERRSETRANDDAELDMFLSECPYPDPGVVSIPAQSAQLPGQLGCLNGSGAFYGSDQVAISGRQVPAYSDAQTLAIYGEMQLPVLDNLNFSVSARREDYDAGKLIGNIYSVAGKWDITDDIYARASYGTNYRAEDALELVPGQVDITSAAFARFGSIQVPVATIVSSDIGPEDDTTFNFGLGYQARIGEGRLRASADFFEVVINGEVVTTPTAVVNNNIFGLNTVAAQTARGLANPLLAGATANSAAQKADCAAALISFVTFSTPCVTGTTTAADLSQVLSFQQNGPSFVTNGVDYSIDYSHPLWGGRASVQLRATQNLVYKQGGYSANGIPFDPGGDRLGFFNIARTGNLSVEWKGDLSVRWANQEHNLNLRANYSSGTYDDRYDGGTLVPIISPGTYSRYGVPAKEYLDFDFTYIYSAPFWDDLKLGLTVLNITDRDPLASQIRSGYYSNIGNPRGRQIKLSLSKVF
jgi:iron complex outermembrane recepter protein